VTAIALTGSSGLLARSSCLSTALGELPHRRRGELRARSAAIARCPQAERKRVCPRQRHPQENRHAQALQPHHGRFWSRRAGIFAIIGGAYDHKVVHDQLAPQKIFFAADPKAMPPDIRQYAGQQVDTAGEAKVFADKYIAVHLKEVAGGQTYSQVSAQFLKDPTNQKLAQQRQTLFMGEMLRGSLLSAWGWGTIGTIATIAGIALIGIGGILLAVPLLVAFAARRREPVAARGRVEPTPAH
jgi:hypothetical protein